MSGTGDPRKSASRPEARSINGDYGLFILAATEADAREFAEAEGYDLGSPEGWMVETGWDQELYDSREQFERESGFSSWWTGCLPPADEQPRDGLLRAWNGSYA